MLWTCRKTDYVMMLIDPYNYMRLNWKKEENVRVQSEYVYLTLLTMPRLKPASTLGRSDFSFYEVRCLHRAVSFLMSRELSSKWIAVHRYTNVFVRSGHWSLYRWIKSTSTLKLIPDSVSSSIYAVVASFSVFWLIIVRISCLYQSPYLHYLQTISQFVSLTIGVYWGGAWGGCLPIFSFA